MSVVSIAKANGHSFEDFWNLVPSPRRIRKALCKYKWDKIISEAGFDTFNKDPETGQLIPVWLQATPDQLIDGLKRDREKKWQGTVGAEKYGWKDGGKFIPMPSTWLNQGRWMDE